MGKIFYTVDNTVDNTEITKIDNNYSGEPININISDNYININKVINQVYLADVSAINRLYLTIYWLLNNTNNKSLPGQLNVHGNIKFTNCIANGNIIIGPTGSNDSAGSTDAIAQIKQNGDIDGNNLKLKGLIMNTGNITVKNGCISVSTDTTTWKSNQLQLINKLVTKDNTFASQWAITNTELTGSTGSTGNKLSFRKINSYIDGTNVLELYDNGDVNIPDIIIPGSTGSTGTPIISKLKVNTLEFNGNFQKRNKAQYIRVGNIRAGTNSNIKQEFALPNYWHLIEIRVFNQKGENVSENKTGATGPSFSSVDTVKGVLGIDNKPFYNSNKNNIINGTIFTDPAKLIDNHTNGYLGDKGYHLLEIKLKDNIEHDIYHIELYNRYLQGVEDEKSKPDYETAFTSRMNGTIIELWSAIPPGKTMNNRTLNRVINTGIWENIYSKEFLL